MKLKYLMIVMIFIIALSIGTVVASENTTINASSGDNSLLSCESSNDLESFQEAHDILADTKSFTDASQDGVDLSVRLDVVNIYKGKEYNRAGFEVPWTITVKVSGGIAKNTKVQEILSDNMEYVSHDASAGIYYPATGIWNIGDLDSTGNVTLKIVTRLKADGRFTNTVNATTDSLDINLKNNYAALTIKSGTGKNTGNITETTDDKNRLQHTDHQLSKENKGFRKIRDTSSKDSSKSKDGGSKSNFKTEGAANQATKSTIGTVSGYLSYMSDSINDIIEGNSTSKEDSNSQNDSSNGHGDAILAYDYTKIPILIFGVFLIVLFALVVYDKIKS